MADVILRQYLPRRLRRWAKRRMKLERLAKGQTTTVPADTIRDLLTDARMPPGLEVDAAAVTALGAVDQTILSGVATSAVNLPNVNRVQPYTARITGFASDSDANGNIFSVGDGTDGFQVALIAPNKVAGIVRDGLDEATAILELDDAVVAGSLYIVIDVNPLFIALGFQAGGAGNVRFGTGNRGRIGGGLAFAPNDPGGAGVVLGLDADGIGGVATGPALGLAGTNAQTWLNANLFA